LNSQSNSDNRCPLGSKGDIADDWTKSALPLTTDILRPSRHVRFGPQPDSCTASLFRHSISESKQHGWNFDAKGRGREVDTNARGDRAEDVKAAG
jgi:hypothetical protein